MSFQLTDESMPVRPYGVEGVYSPYERVGDGGCEPAGNRMEEAEASSTSSCSSLKPIFENWADQVEYEEALLAEAGLRLGLTWEELVAATARHHRPGVADEDDDAYDGRHHPSYPYPRRHRQHPSAGSFSSSSFCTETTVCLPLPFAEDELGAYLAMVRDSKYAFRGARRALPPPRGGSVVGGAGKRAPRHPDGAAALGNGVVMEHSQDQGSLHAERRQKRGTKRKNRSRTASASSGTGDADGASLGAPGHDRHEDGSVRSGDDAASASAENNGNACSTRKNKKRGKKDAKQKTKKKASEVGRKLFVGGIIFADLEEDKEAQELRTKEETALLAEIRREVFVEAVLGAFGEIERLSTEWENRYCHVIYASRADADRAFTALSDHQERRKLCEEAATALLREAGLPEAAAPLPNFYVRWPKDNHHANGRSTQPRTATDVEDHTCHSSSHPAGTEKHHLDESERVQALTA